MIIVCGEALVDLVPTDGPAFLPRVGGSPVNVAVALGRLGVDVSLIARLADDPFGRSVREHLVASRVDLGLAGRSAHPTTLAVVDLDPAGGAGYRFYVDGASDGGWSVADLPPRLPAGAALHVSGSLALGVPSMGDAVEHLLRRERGHRTITFDPNVRPGITADHGALRARLDRWLGMADVVKVSAEDLAWIAPGDAVEDVAARWRERGPSLVVVTRGGRGVHAAGPAGTVDLRARPVTVVDTIGAGDTFMAGLLAALDAEGALDRAALPGLGTERLTAALTHAQRVAAITCTRVGADPPWAEDLTRTEGSGLLPTRGEAP